MKKNNFIMLSLLICLIISISGCNSNPSLTSTNDPVVIEIAATLQVTPSWAAIRDHLFAEFKPGMTRDEVHKILDKVGPWTFTTVETPDLSGRILAPADGLYRENIRFTEKRTFNGLGYWGFLFDKNSLLVRQGPVDLN